MGYCEHLKALLHPMGVYDLSEGSLSFSEIQALGTGLDGADEALALAEREAAIATAEDLGLDRWESLFARTPVRVTTALRRQAIAALLRIHPDAFTLAAINDTLAGCGVKAIVEEKDTFGYVRVIFPEVAGIPPEFEQISSIILDIIPCHLEVEFHFRYLTWEECHRLGYTWAIVHGNQWTWTDFMLAV